MIWSRKLSYLSFLTLVLATASGACVIESDGDDDDDAGSAGAAGSGASGTSGKSGGSGTAGVSGSGGSSGASGAGGASGGGGSGGSGGSVSSECGLLQGPAEAEPNGDTTTATAYGLGVASHGCIVEADLDTYSFTTPADGTGGGVLIEFTEVGKGSATPLGTLSVSVRTEGDNGDLYSTYNPNAGGNLSAYFAAAPGRTYYVQVGAFSSGDAKFVYTMKATYTAVADA
ncbi:MAG: hypothetical protein MUF34_28580, partial [Polyangiaceae bacterium]|nr:hypothetical protein [Polyangiaceae bacterium]